jgi:hypothetical protein
MRSIEKYTGRDLINKLAGEEITDSDSVQRAFLKGALDRMAERIPALAPYIAEQRAAAQAAGAGFASGGLKTPPPAKRDPLGPDGTTQGIA